MPIFEKAQVKKNYVQFAFLFVHTVYLFIQLFTSISLASILLDKIKQRRPRSDADQGLRCLLTECYIKSLGTMKYHPTTLQ